MDNAWRVIADFAQKSSKELTTLSEKIQDMSRDWLRMGREMVMDSALQAAALAQPVRDFMALETAQTDLASATLRAGGVMNPALDHLHAKAVELGNTLPGTTADFKNMMTMLTRQGMASPALRGRYGLKLSRLPSNLHDVWHHPPCGAGAD